MPDLTKDAVLALADRLANTAATYMRQDVADASVMLRRLALLLDGEEEFGEAVADAINRARYGVNHPFGPRPLNEEDRTSQEYARRLAHACLPLIHTRIAQAEQAEQAATEREREACALIAMAGPVGGTRIAAAIGARNTEKGGEHV